MKNMKVQNWPVIKKGKLMKQRKELTQAEVNLVLVFMQEISRNVQEWTVGAKDLNRRIYTQVDKADPRTTPLFKDMNKLRNKIRRVKEANKRVSTIIHKLKTQR